jgi:hypothetical protein
MYPPDQVPRLNAFRAAHPDIEITSPLESLSNFWTAYKDGVVVCVRYDLRRLLDKLEESCD